MKLPKRAERRRRGLIKFIKRLQHQINVTDFGGYPHGWKDVEEYKRDNTWIALLKHTVKLCGKDCCRGPRRSRWHKTKEKLTRQERRMLDDFEQQVKELENEDPNIR
jgi:hypothetical protein